MATQDDEFYRAQRDTILDRMFDRDASETGDLFHNMEPGLDTFPDDSLGCLCDQLLEAGFIPNTPVCQTVLMTIMYDAKSRVWVLSGPHFLNGPPAVRGSTLRDAFDAAFVAWTPLEKHPHLRDLLSRVDLHTCAAQRLVTGGHEHSLKLEYGIADSVSDRGGIDTTVDYRDPYEPGGCPLMVWRPYNTDASSPAYWGDIRIKPKTKPKVPSGARKDKCWIVHCGIYKYEGFICTESRSLLVALFLCETVFASLER